MRLAECRVYCGSDKTMATIRETVPPLRYACSSGTTESFRVRIFIGYTSFETLYVSGMPWAWRWR